MNDRELLEMAAKAAGIVGEFVTGYGSGDFYYQGNQDGILIRHPDGGLTVWNPLTDDGDALRLAVTLNIRTKRYQGMITAEYPANDGIHEWRVLCEQVLDDYYAATRRAIVRCAAEIGKAMP